MIRFGNVELPKPITIASGPLTDKFTKIQAAHEHDAGAVSLKLTFVKVPFQSQMRSYSVPDDVIISPTNKRLDLEHGVELMKQVKAELPIVMFANFGAVGAKLDDWKILSEAFQAAGSDILELNFCCPNLDTSGVSVGRRVDHGGAAICENPDTSREIMQAVKRIVDIPVIVKVISGEPHLLLEAAQAVEAEGCDGIHVVGLPISGLPPLDDDGKPLMPLIKGVPQGSTNGAVCKYATFLATAQLAKVVKMPIMASGGFMNWKDCIDAIYWGASAPSICSAPMWHGFQVVQSMNEGIADFMERRGYSSFDDFRGLAVGEFTTPDKVQLEEGHSVIDEERCIGCGRCAKPAHCEAIQLVDDKAQVDKDECIGCGVCWSLCPTGAISYKVLEDAEEKE